jgi:hypothetical protein
LAWVVLLAALLMLLRRRYRMAVDQSLAEERRPNVTGPTAVDQQRNNHRLGMVRSPSSGSNRLDEYNDGVQRSLMDDADMEMSRFLASTASRSGRM